MNTSKCTHLPGDIIFAIAEGTETDHISDEDMAHAFSCEECEQTLREIRASLQFLKTSNSPSKAKSQDAADELSLTDEDDEDLDSMLFDLNLQDGDAPESAIRKSMLGVLLMGGIAMILLILMQMFLERSS